MVPSFGLFEFEASSNNIARVEDQERAGFLAEVVQRSTQFGAGFNESRKREAQGEGLFRVF